ncbi:hypothetical protein L1987_10639 [Smallanthus sonchifolius]|uniref:Uncharacterized protein n=1 Tax=Smallanthus sonchifolius TaxID=185202 RepID=A0ACB9JAX2_9ASTR|nr:hypothetical protein L1987_10639 [Smallanthus sonchifolius]
MSGESIGYIPRDIDHPMHENPSGDKVQTELTRIRVDEDETMMGENEVIAGEFARKDSEKFTVEKGDTIEKSLHQSLEESTEDMQDDGKDVWDELCMRPVGVKWPDPWGQPLAPGFDNNVWSLVLQRAKVSTVMGNKACWLDVERENCHREEAIHKKKKKKQKSKGNNPFDKMHGKEPDHGTNEGGTMHGDGTRKKHKIWFSRNRRLAKNLLLQKINFIQNAIPVIAPLNLLGMGEFKTGHAKSKDPIPKYNIKESHMSRMDNLFEDLVAKRAKLKEIASNINTTDENNLLVKSLLAMKHYKNKYTQVHEGRSGHQRNNAEEGGIVYERNIVNRPTRNTDGNELPSIPDRMYQQTSANTNNYTRDRLVPLDSSLSEWSKPMIEYFRHLYSIYEFGAGTSAATHERMSMIDTSNNDHENVEMLIEEVESEEDGTAEMMKSDSPSTTNTSWNKEEGMEVCNPTDMLVDGTKDGDN